jgi:hypothetical protein
MIQEVLPLKLVDLVLWTENPRDSVDANATDQDIVNRALEDSRAKWGLHKLAREMGPYYDLSELPTVVMHGEKPVVYDGNRRVALGKIKKGIVQVAGLDPASLPDFPEELPCNVCAREVALKNVYRKHADSGSWLPLDRDIFVHKFMGGPKSLFMQLEESTGLISANSHLNQRFVKEEVLKEDTLARLGIIMRHGQMLSRMGRAETLQVLGDLSNKVRDKLLSTRKGRGQVLDVLDPETRRVIDESRTNPHQELSLRDPSEESAVAGPRRQNRRTRMAQRVLFGGALYLRSGDVGNLYRDIVDLYNFYGKNKATLSGQFSSLVRMSLRLIVECAARDVGKSLDDYVKPAFPAAKAGLSQDAKTTLSNHNVTESSIMQLLHTGAHNYSASSNIEQTLAVSLVLGAILNKSHGQGGSL